ncbi:MULTISPECIES: phosphoribosyltransferase [unclassified Glutamicibacter]|uniref:phosphoribosyltransferase n=1 Tax=unclassified Glutamicibacter TaxID=2627139 RepID=UPI003812DFF5
MATGRSTVFENRSHAGAALGMKLSTLLPAGEYTVLGLLRGGVPIAHEVARALGATLGAVAVRKLGVPRNPELAFGAIARYGISSARHINEAIYRRALQYFGKDELESVERGTGADLRALAGTFKDYCPDLAGRDLLLCDDGMATGATMKAALDLIQDLDPASITLAVPVASPGTAGELAPRVNGLCQLLTPENFTAVGAFYEDFGQVGQDQVLEMLRSAR